MTTPLPNLETQSIALVTSVPMTVLTLNTDESAALENWRQTLINNKYSRVKILGLGKKWQGFSWKTKMYIGYLKKLLKQYGDSHIVMTCDSTDVLFLQPQDMLLAKFKVLGQTVVVSADDTQLVGQFANQTTNDLARQIIEKRLGRTTPYMWINSGLCIGYVGYMIEFYEKIKDYADDQEGVQMEWLSDPKLCWVDYEQHLFATLSGMRHIGKMRKSQMVTDLKFDSKSGFHRHLVTKTYPSAVHFPGKITTTYNEFIQDWQVATQELNPVAWQGQLQCIAGRNLGGIWAWQFYAKTYLKAHKRELKLGTIVLASILIAFILWKIMRAKFNRNIGTCFPSDIV